MGWPDRLDFALRVCESRPYAPITTILAVDGRPVAILVCSQCRRTLDQQHALLDSAVEGFDRHVISRFSRPEQKMSPDPSMLGRGAHEAKTETGSAGRSDSSDVRNNAD